MEHDLRSSQYGGRLKSIRLDNISKSFPGVRALNGVSMEFKAGEVVSIVGQNGAGKSTLMDILGGVKQPDSGHIYFDEKPVSFASPKNATQQGIAYIHQELTVFNNLSVAENIMFDRIGAKKPLSFINSDQIKQDCVEILGMIDPSIQPGDSVADLAVGKKQVVEISRAIASDASVIIFDEPTSSLTLKEKENLYKLINLLKINGYIIVYITHHFEEIFQIADRIYVLRDGENAGDTLVSDTNTTELTKMMLGEYVSKMFSSDRGPDQRAPEPRDDLLRVSNLSTINGIEDVSFTLRKKEVLGVWGLLGSGRTELARAVLKLDAATSGKAEIKTDDGFSELPDNYVDVFGYVPENRREEGLFLDSSILANISVGRIRDFSNKFGFVNKRYEAAKAEEAARDIGIKMVDLKQKISQLSGGNQQKAILARWMMIKPEIIILDDPTKGLDVGAKADVYRLIEELVDDGISIILISSDIDEITHLSDRVILLSDKKIETILDRSQINNETLTKFTLGSQ